MARYALIITASGAVDNVIEYDGSAPFTPPTGQELRVATDDAEPGGTWNGSAFVRAPAVVQTRTQVLIYEVTNPVASYDNDGVPTNKTADEIAAGISGHRALALTAECEDTDLPTDRYFRNAWEWSD